MKTFFLASLMTVILLPKVLEEYHKISWKSNLCKSQMVIQMPDFEYMGSIFHFFVKITQCGDKMCLIL